MNITANVLRNLNAYIFFCLATALAQSQTIGAPGTRVAEPFPLSDVHLLDSVFKQNMERNARYLLSLEPDRLLHNTRQYCGLQPKGDIYGGWEKRVFAGQTLGHYLTAISQQYAATGDARFRQRIDYIVQEMAVCQERYGDGYIGAMPPLALAALRGLKAGKVGLNGAGVPWYTEHKVLAGLKDAWVLGGNAQAKTVALKLADWVDALTAGLTPNQQQEMLVKEFGGMNEVLVELYQLTGNTKYLDVSRRFYHQAVMDPLAAGKDELPGKHANSQIPKVIGEAVRYEATGDENGRKIAENFWNLVTAHYLFAMGGLSDKERFFPEDQASEHLSFQTAETCVSYNMLKLTEHLFEWKPMVAYGDYYEKALYNHILASQEPQHGMFTYFIPLKPGSFRTYSTPEDSFWCCVDTGMENHTKYGEAIYFHDDSNLYVNLFIPSVLTWKERKFTLRQETGYPDGDRTELIIQSASLKPLTLQVRCSSWANGPLTFELNNESLAVDAKPGQFAKIKRVWHPGDRVKIVIPMGLRTEALQGASNKVAIFYGPLLLAGDLGAVPHSTNYPWSREHNANIGATTADVPVFVKESPTSLLGNLRRIPGPRLVFQTTNLAKPKEVVLRPFKDLAYEYYNVYWDVIPEAEWAKQLEARARLVDEFNPGEHQSEMEHGLVADHSRVGDFKNSKWRDAMDGGFFQFRMKVLPGTPQDLCCTYWGGDTNRDFDILINGKLLAIQRLSGEKPGKFLDIDYPIATGLIAGMDHITIRFKPHDGSIAGGIFHATVLRGAP